MPSNWCLILWCEFQSKLFSALTLRSIHDLKVNVLIPPKGPPSIHRKPGLIEMYELNSGIGISLKFGPLSALYIANIIDLGLKGDFGK